MFQRVVFLTVLALLAGFCTPPPNWKERSPLYGPSYMKTRPMMGKSGSIRVLLHTGPAVTIFSEGNYLFRGKRGAQKGGYKFLPKESGKLKFHAERFIFKKTSYRGSLQIIKRGNVFVYINHIPLEEYLVSVVGHEMSPSWPLEALKAQAVVARTYAYTRKQRTKSKNFDIGTTTSDQVYGGALSNEGNVRQAVYATLSEVVTYRGHPAQVFFHSCCGGKTAKASEVWGQDFPYLVNKRCEFKESPEYNWQKSFSFHELEKRLSLSKITNISVSKRSLSGRVKSLKIKHQKGVIEMPSSKFRSSLGATRVKSTLFNLKLTGKKLMINGHGYGHGVGLCQWCAKIMAEKQSMRYRSIINWFFPGTRLSRLR